MQGYFPSVAYTNFLCVELALDSVLYTNTLNIERVEGHKHGLCVSHGIANIISLSRRHQLFWMFRHVACKFIWGRHDINYKNKSQNPGFPFFSSRPYFLRGELCIFYAVKIPDL